MPSDYKGSPACCSTPVIIGPPYTTLGRFDEIDGTKTYINTSASSTKALFMIYDVFGYSSQILQGADKLAASGYQICMPDFFKGHPAPLAWMPMPDATTGLEPPEDTKAIHDFIEGPGNTERTVARVLELQLKLQLKFPHIQAWGLVGYCWGGYVANFLLGSSTPFQACAELHPGFPGRDIAETITMPIIALLSKDEPEADYAETFRPYLRNQAQFLHFSDMVHGWMSARGDLQNPRVRVEFNRGYDLLLDFFQQHL